MDIAAPLLRAVIAVGLVVGLTRLVALRSFSTMTGFDFVCTVAIGSLLAAAVMASGRQFIVSLVALIAVFLTQWGAAQVRAASSGARRVIDNTPLLLMQDGRFLDDNIAAAHMAKDDVRAKLREANALDLARVKAVILEVTGDVSVLHGDLGDAISPEVLRDVRR